MSSSKRWDEPGIFEVAQGVFRIPLPLPQDGLAAVNVYAIFDEGEVTLIDGGWAVRESGRQLEAALTEVGLHVGDISQILVTHIHRDHYTQAVDIRRKHGSRIALGAGERGSLAVLNVAIRPLTAQLRQIENFGDTELAREVEEMRPARLDPTNWEVPDRWMEGEFTVSLPNRRLIALPTPGHTRGHYVFMDPDHGLMFSGDHILPHITPSIGFESSPAPNPLASYLRSLKCISRLPDMTLLPGHGAVTDSVHRRVGQLLSHHSARLSACLDAVDAGAQTVRETAHTIPWTRHGKNFIELSVFDRMLAAIETEAHLKLLVSQRHLTVVPKKGVPQYETTA